MFTVISAPILQKHYTLTDKLCVNHEGMYRCVHGCDGSDYAWTVCINLRGGFLLLLLIRARIIKGLSGPLISTGFCLHVAWVYL